MFLAVPSREQPFESVMVDSEADAFETLGEGELRADFSTYPVGTFGRYEDVGIINLLSGL